MGRWYVDKYPLSRYAFNVKNRGAAWKVAEKRGENVVVPGRSGSVHAENKPYADGTVGLEMWAVGADLDGSMPTDVTRAQACREHLDTLSRLFGSNELVEIARTDDDAVEYGRRNLLRNPSFEAVDGKVAVRWNTVENPSGEASTGEVRRRVNRVLNPSMEKMSGSRVVRTNLVSNPRMQRQGSPFTERRNLVPNPSGETSIRFWRGRFGADCYRVRGDIGGEGQYLIRGRSKADGPWAVECGPVDASGGLTYTMQAKYRNNAGSQRTLRCRMDFWNRRGVSLANVYTDVVAVAGGQGLFSTSGEAPAGTVRISARLSCQSSASQKGETADFDEVMVEQSASLGSYFDGDSLDGDGIRFRWADDEGVSTSDGYRVRPGTYESTGANRVGLTETESLVGRYSARVLVTGDMSDETLIRQQVRYGCEVRGRVQVSGSVAARLGEAIESSREVVVRLGCWDKSGGWLGWATTADGGAVDGSAQYTVENGSWLTMPLDGVWTRPRTAKVTADVAAAGPWTAGDVVYVDCVLVEEESYAGVWFDGTLSDTDLLEYRWTGDPHHSTAEAVGDRCMFWRGVSGVALRYGDGRYGGWSVRVTPSTLDPERRLGFGQAVMENLDAGAMFSWSCWVRVNRQQQVLGQVGWVVGDVTTWVSGVPVDGVVDGWVRVSVPGVVPPEGCDDAVVRVVSAEGPQAGDVIDGDSALFEASQNVRDYFNGNSGGSFAWAGAGGVSESWDLEPRADGWGRYGSGKAQVYRTDEDASVGKRCVEAWNREDGPCGVSTGAEAVEPDQLYTFAVDVWPSVARPVQVGVVWRDARNQVVSTDQVTEDAAAGVWARHQISVEAPAGAAVGRPFAVVREAAADEVARFDAAIFGAGGDGSYADGDSGDGWEWVGKRRLSESRQMADRAPWWEARGGSVQRSTDWSVDRAASGLYVTHDPDGTSLAPFGGSGEEYTFAGEHGETYTFGVQVKAREACRVLLHLRGYEYDGFRNNLVHVVEADPVDLAAGEESRLLVSGVPIPTGSGGTHVKPWISVEASGGGAAPAETGLWVDEAFLSAGSSVRYIDGESEWVRWTGGKDDSASEVFGPARRAMVEVTAGIDMTSMAGGTRAEFQVEGVIPSTFWEDTYTTSMTFPVAGSGRVVPLAEFAGGTASIEDALITVEGPCDWFKLTDVESGAWCLFDHGFAGQVTIDNRRWTARYGNGKTHPEFLRYGGGPPQILPLTVAPRGAYPRLKVDGRGFGEGASVTVKGRRRYHIA